MVSKKIRIYQDGSFDPLAEFTTDKSFLNIRGDGWEPQPDVALRDPPEPVAPSLPPPPVDSPPVVAPPVPSQPLATGWYKPNSVADFVAAQQKCLDDGKMLMLDPSTVLEFTTPVEFKLRGGFSFPNGLWAYGAQFKWKTDGDWTRRMLTYKTEGQENQYFTIKGLSINGDQTGGSQASPDRLLYVEGRSGAAIRGFQIDDFTWEGCLHGLWIEGEVFEGYVNRPRGSWSRHAGIVCRHGYDIPGVFSNVYIIEPNITRAPANMGTAMGIFCDRACSVLIEQGNFISLDGPAIKGSNGVKRISNCDFENAGNVRGNAIEIDDNDFWSQVLACEGSNTSGNMPYLLRYGGNPAALDLVNCRMYNGTVLRP